MLNDLKAVCYFVEYILNRLSSGLHQLFELCDVHTVWQFIHEALNYKTRIYAVSWLCVVR